MREINIIFRIKIRLAFLIAFHCTARKSIAGTKAVDSSSSRQLEMVIL